MSPKQSTADQKIDWLIEHRGLWHQLPLTSSPSWDRRHAETLASVASQMTAAGLYSPGTYIRDVEESVFKHIRLSRRYPAAPGS
jgi:hypothetical protein